MTVDEALEHTRCIWDKGGTLEDCSALKTLASEVERLRSENELLKAERDGQRQVWAMSHKSRGDLVEWFTSREPLITRMLWAPTHTAFLERARIIDWEREHPQPEVDE